MNIRPGLPRAGTMASVASALALGLALTQPIPAVLARAREEITNPARAESDGTPMASSPSASAPRRSSLPVTPAASASDLPPMMLPVATTAQIPLTAAYDALNVPSLAAGNSYPDPTSGVTIYKLTSATFPTSAASWGHDYAEGGDEVSLPYDGTTRAVLVYDGTSHWLVDFTPGVGVGNPRPFPDDLAPVRDLAFTFSNNAATPYYAYVSDGSSILRMDIRTMSRADGDGWPVSNEDDAVWLHQSENDGMFVWLRGAEGPMSVVYDPGTATKKIYTDPEVNEPRIDRGGRYVGFAVGSPINGLKVWDWDANGVVWTSSGDPDVPFGHCASLRRRWYQVDWNASFPPPYATWTPEVPGSAVAIGGPANSNLVHGNGSWIQHPPDLDDQWAVFTHYGSLRPEEDFWLAPGGMVLITANGERRLLAHPYNTTAEYTLFSFPKFSSDGKYVLFTSDMNGSGRSDLFLAELPEPGAETNAPTVSIVAPVPGAMVSGGAVDVTATASDDVWVVGVQFELDEGALGAEDSSAPYSVPWDTTIVANGSHRLRAVARDSSGNSTVSSPVVVTVSNPPVISSVLATGLSASGATIEWITNEAANSQVEYGLTTAYGSATTLDPSLVLAHSQSLIGLAPATVYHYRVRSTDALGNLALSPDATFITVDNVAPFVSGVSATNITSSAATIVWTTDEPADSRVNYGTTVSYGSNTTLNTSLVVSHSQALTSLTAGTLYHFGVRSRDAAGNLTVSEDFTFTTAAAPLPVICPASSVAPGASFNTTVNGGSSTKDWVASYVPGAPNTTWLGAFKYVPVPRPAIVAMTAPATAGTYDLRLFANDTFTLIGSCTYQVGAGAASSLSINDVTVTEGNAGTTNATFTVTLSPAATGTVTVNLATTNGTATAGTDYTASSSSVTFDPGDLMKTLTVVVNGDTTAEANETFFVNLSGASGATIADGLGQATITNDDTSGPSLTCPVSVAPGASFNTTVSGGSLAKDWVASYLPGAPNTTWLGAFKYVPVPRPAIVAMTAPATAGTYDLRLFANDTFTLIGSCTYQVETGSSLSINDITVTEGNAGTTNATFTVTLSPAATGTVTVNLATTNGTATAGTDYTASSSSVTFDPGDLMKTLTVVVNGDTTAEANETFFVNVSGASGATIADGLGQATITNDDSSGSSLTCPILVAPGASFNTTVSGGSLAKDWVASYLPGAPNTTWLGAFKYVPVPRPAIVAMTAPATAGTYDLRLFANDTFTLIGSCTYQVSTAP